MNSEAFELGHSMTTQTPSAASSGAISRGEERAILTITCLATYLFFNSFGSISVALPTVQKQFGNSLAEIQWITLMGVVTISSFSFCFGRAGGLIGQRRLYKIGVALYSAGAVLGALSASSVQLLSSRAIMAVGLAMALPSDPAAFSSAQQFAFDCLAPIGVLAILIAFNSRPGVEPNASAAISVRR